MYATGRGGSLYWLTTTLDVSGVQGMYLVDTGSSRLVTKQEVSRKMNPFPTVQNYVGGAVEGYETVGSVTLAKGNVVRAPVLQKVNCIPAGKQNIHGILGLMPGRNSVIGKSVWAVEVDFRSHMLSFNQPATYQPTIHITRSQILNANKLGLRCDLVAHMREPPYTLKYHDVRVLLDTGSTVALTFLDSTYKEYDTCSTDSRIHAITIKCGYEELTRPVPPDTLWPSCLPTPVNGTWHEGDCVVLGIQFLNHMTCVRYTLEDGELQSLSLTK
jgi:hypothetical protein